MTTATLAVPELRSLSLAQLADAWDSGRITFADAAAECARRDAAERRAATIRARQSEWFDAAHAQYVQADIECRGELLSPLGERNVRDEISLWRCSESDAMRWGKRGVARMVVCQRACDTGPVRARDGR